MCIRDRSLSITNHCKKKNEKLYVINRRVFLASEKKMRLNESHVTKKPLSYVIVQDTRTECYKRVLAKFRRHFH